MWKKISINDVEVNVAMPELSQEVLDAYSKAKASQVAAKQADDAVSAANTELDAVTVKVKGAQDTALATHKTALDDAHAALDALQKDLGLTLTP
jgi:hypothetical protein